MLAKLSSIARSGLVSMVALAMLPAAANAVPLGRNLDPVLAGGGAVKAIPVEMGEGRSGGPGYRYWPRVRGGGQWNGNWNGGWRGRHWHGGHWRNGGYWGRGWGSGVALGLGIGVPLGYYGGYRARYYDPYYDPYYYDEPVYRPRYRPRVSQEPRRAYRTYRNYNGEVGPHCDNAYLSGRNYNRC